MLVEYVSRLFYVVQDREKLWQQRELAMPVRRMERERKKF